MSTFQIGESREEQALHDLLRFPFVDALFRRRSCRFFSCKVSELKGDPKTRGRPGS